MQKEVMDDHYDIFGTQTQSLGEMQLRPNKKKVLKRKISNYLLFKTPNKVKSELLNKLLPMNEEGRQKIEDDNPSLGGKFPEEKKMHTERSYKKNHQLDPINFMIPAKANIGKQQKTPNTKIIDSDSMSDEEDQIENQKKFLLPQIKEKQEQPSSEQQEVENFYEKNKLPNLNRFYLNTKFDQSEEKQGVVAVKYNDDVFIQPNFMSQRGSMCSSELWSLKLRKQFCYIDSPIRQKDQSSQLTSVKLNINQANPYKLLPQENQNNSKSQRALSLTKLPEMANFENQNNFKSLRALSSTRLPDMANFDDFSIQQNEKIIDARRYKMLPEDKGGVSYFRPGKMSKQADVFYQLKAEKQGIFIKRPNLSQQIYNTISSKLPLDLLYSPKQLPQQQEQQNVESCNIDISYTDLQNTQETYTTLVSSTNLSTKSTNFLLTPFSSNKKPLFKKLDDILETPQPKSTQIKSNRNQSSIQNAFNKKLTIRKNQNSLKKTQSLLQIPKPFQLETGSLSNILNISKGSIADEAENQNKSSKENKKKFERLQEEQNRRLKSSVTDLISQCNQTLFEGQITNNGVDQYLNEIFEEKIKLDKRIEKREMDICLMN